MGSNSTISSSSSISASSLSIQEQINDLKDDHVLADSHSLRDEIVCQEFILQSMIRIGKVSSFHGENVLHVAIAKKDLEMVKYLLRDGGFSPETVKKLINGRATGTFFAPGQEIYDKTGTEVIRLRKMARSDDRLYFGEYPIAFAVCTNQVDMVDFLLERGAKLSQVDSYGNTLFHLCVAHELIPMLEHLYTKLQIGYKCDILHDGHDGLDEFYPFQYKNNDGYTPLQLAASLGLYNMFDHVLKKGRILRWQYASLSCWSYPLDDLLFSTYNGKRTGAVKLIVEKYHIQLLRHPVVGAILDKRWVNEFRTRFLVNLFITIIAIVSLTIASLISTNNPACAAIIPPSPFENIENGIDTKGKCSFSTWMIYSFFRIIIIGICYGKLRVETVEMQSRGLRSYFSGSFPQIFENVTSTCACVFSLFSLFVTAFPLPFIYVPGFVALAILTSYAYSLFYLLGFSRTGPFIIMISRMFMEDVFVFSIVFVVFLMSFASAGYVLRAGSEILIKEAQSQIRESIEKSASQAEAFTPSNSPQGIHHHHHHYTVEEEETNGYTFGHELEETFESMFGNFDLSWYDFSNTAKVLHILYVILSTVLLFNTLIAKMSKTFEAIQQNAVLVWKIERARIMDSLESEDSENEQKSMSYWVAAGKGESKRYFVEVSEDDEAYYAPEQPEKSSDNELTPRYWKASDQMYPNIPSPIKRAVLNPNDNTLLFKPAKDDALNLSATSQLGLNQNTEARNNLYQSSSQSSIISASNVAVSSNKGGDRNEAKSRFIKYNPQNSTRGLEVPEFDVDSPSGTVQLSTNTSNGRTNNDRPSKRGLLGRRFSLIGKSKRFFSLGSSKRSDSVSHE